MVIFLEARASSFRHALCRVALSSGPSHGRMRVVEWSLAGGLSHGQQWKGGPAGAGRTAERDDRRIWELVVEAQRVWWDS